MAARIISPDQLLFEEVSSLVAVCNVYFGEPPEALKLARIGECFFDRDIEDKGECEIDSLFITDLPEYDPQHLVEGTAAEVAERITTVIKKKFTGRNTWISCYVNRFNFVTGHINGICPVYGLYAYKENAPTKSANKTGQIK